MCRLVLLCLFVPLPLFAQSADEKKAAVAFLVSLQQPDGGFVAIRPDARRVIESRSSLRATSGAVRAIQYLGGEVPNRDKVLAFVTSCYDAATGAFADSPGGKPETASTSIGMMAMAALRPEFSFDKSIGYLADQARAFEERRLAVAGMEAARKFAPQVQEWLREIEKSRNLDGTYGMGSGVARETGGIVAMKLRSGGTLPDDQRKAIVAALVASQGSDGGFGKADAKSSDMETTYRVLRAFHLLKERPKDVMRLREFVARHRNPDGGFGTAPGQPSSVSGTYYAAIIGYWLDH